jgi:hypothetical protein
MRDVGEGAWFEVLYLKGKESKKTCQTHINMSYLSCDVNFKRETKENKNFASWAIQVKP